MPRQNARRIPEGAPAEEEEIPLPVDRRPKLSDLMKDYRGWWNLPRGKSRPSAAPRPAADVGDSWRAA